MATNKANLNWRTIWMVGGTLVMVLGLSAWIYLQNFQDPPKKLTIAEASQPVFALVYIAEHEGYFADEGLDVNYKSFTSGRDALNSVIAGEADLATVFETPVVLRAAEGQALSILTTLHKSNANTALVARRDRNISKPADLRGKTIGVSTGTNGEFFLYQLLTSHGIPLSEVNFINTKPQVMAETLRNGSVDAVATWNPNLYNAKQAIPSANRVAFFSNIYTELSVLTGKREYVANNSETVQRVLNALFRAEQFLQTNEKEGLRIVIQQLKTQPEATIRAVWGDAKPDLSLDNILLSILRREAIWFKEKGILKGSIPEFRVAIDSRFLKNVKPEAVTLLGQ